MKPILLICAALGSGAIGAATATLITSNRSETPREVAQATSPNSGSNQTDDLLAKLMQRIEFLEAEHNSLKALGARAEVPAAPADPQAQETQVAKLVVDSQLRDQVLQVIEDQRVAEQKKREDERRAREEQQVLRRAEKIAKELSLAPGEEKRLADFLFASNARREEIMTEMRDLGFDRDLARERFEEMRVWGQTQLDKSFGATLSKQILEADPGVLGFGGGRRFGNNAGGGEGGPPQFFGGPGGTGGGGQAGG